MGRAILDLGAGATVLEAAERLSAAPPDGDVALVVAAGAPVLRSAVFLDVLRAQAGPRHLSLVTTDARARSLASAAHVAAYASLAALERHELDATERLTPARRAAIASMRPATVATPRPSLRRILGVGASLAGALAILAAVVVPEAKVIVAPAAQPLGPIEATVHGTTGGSADVTLRTLTQPVTAKIVGAATGARSEEIRAKGTVQLENKTTDDVRVAKGSIFKTAEGVQFLSTADVTLLRSVIVPPFTLFVGKVTAPVEAAVAGSSGNVAPGRITFGPDPNRYTVTNGEPAAGGDIRRIPVVKAEDYEAAVKKAPGALRAAADEQLQKWQREPRTGETVVPQALVRQTSTAPASADVVGKETDAFELTVSGIATAYLTADTEPRKAIASKLREAAARENDVDDRSVLFDLRTLTVADDGVTWTVTARGQQIKRVDRDRIGRLLAGRAVRDVQPVLEGEGLRLVRLDRLPAWWPLLPLLDARITVQVETRAVGSVP